MMLKLSKKKKNKGFTLVELIIVVAILAILVGLLAPQYTKYVEKSRKSADINNLNEIVNAIKIAATDPEYNLGSNENPETFYTIAIGSFSDDYGGADYAYVVRGSYDKTNNQIKEALSEYAGLAFSTNYENEWLEIENIKIKSRKWGQIHFADTGYFMSDGVAAHIVLDNSTGSITVTYSDNVVNYLDHGTID